MSSDIVIFHRALGYDAILNFLERFDTCFDPPFSASVDLKQYAQKLFDNAYFITAEVDDFVVGIIAYYRNEVNEEYYVPYFAVSEQYQGQSIGQNLLDELVRIGDNNYKRIALEVAKSNIGAYRFYVKNDFEKQEERSHKLLMIKNI